MTDPSTQFRNSRWTGLAFGAAIVSLLVSLLVIVLLVLVIQDADAQQVSTCNAIEDVVRETLIPLNPPDRATPDQIVSYDNAARQKIQRLDQITAELRRGADCRISVQVRK